MSALCFLFVLTFFFFFFFYTSHAIRSILRQSTAFSLAQKLFWPLHPATQTAVSVLCFLPCTGCQLDADHGPTFYFVNELLKMVTDKRLCQDLVAQHSGCMLKQTEWMHSFWCHTCVCVAKISGHCFYRVPSKGGEPAGKLRRILDQQKIWKQKRWQMMSRALYEM